MSALRYGRKKFNSGRSVNSAAQTLSLPPWSELQHTGTVMLTVIVVKTATTAMLVRIFCWYEFLLTHSGLCKKCINELAFSFTLNCLFLFITTQLNKMHKIRIIDFLTVANLLA